MFKEANDKSRFRSLVQATSEARRWEGFARAKGFKADVLNGLFTRRDCRIDFVNGKWRVSEIRVAGLTEIAREDMLIAALKRVH